MATFLGPLVLVLVGAGGLIVVFGRRLPDLRGHLALAARSADRTASRARPGARARLARAVRVARALLRGTGRILVVSGRAIGRLLKRPPVTLRVPRIAVPSMLRRRVPAPSPTASVRQFLSPELRRENMSPPERPSTTITPPVVITDLPIHHETVSGPDHEDESLRDVALGVTETPDAADSDRLSTRAALMGAAAARAESDEKAPGVVSSTPPEALSVGVQPPASQAIGRAPRNTPKRKPAARARRERVPPLPAVTLDMEEGSLDEAAKLLKDGQLARAEAMLVDALAENPRDLDAYRLLGQLYLQRDDFVQAREVLEEALRRDAAQTTLYGLLGRTYFGLGEYGKALRLYQRAHDTDEGNLEYLERLLFIASRMDRRPLVKVTAEKILALEPNHAEAKMRLARVAN